MEEVKSSPAPPVVPNRLPTLGLRDLVFFPAMVLPLLVGRPRSVAALEEATEAGAGGYLTLTRSTRCGLGRSVGGGPTSGWHGHACRPVDPLG